LSVLLDVRGLSVRFPGAGRASDAGALTAVREVSFSIAAGEVLGLVGESGSGKSVTSLALMGLLPPQAGVSGVAELCIAGAPSVDLFSASREQLRGLRGSRMAMIFQEPMTALNPVMRVGDQVAEAVLAHAPQTSKKEAGRRAVEALREVALPEPEKSARDYPHQLSGGMRQRVMIAMAIVNRPQLLIADEPTTALDVTIQAQILELLQELRVKFNLAMLFISHDLGVVSRVADRVAVMYAGSLVEMAGREELFRSPAHPYTRGLLRAVPTLRTERGRPLSVIEGSVPSLRALPPGCLFEPRCEFRLASCVLGLPELVEVGRGHWSRCPVTQPAMGGGHLR
jgi:peptide/nickel transport system ATP-binding protein